MARTAAREFHGWFSAPRRQYVLSAFIYMQIPVRGVCLLTSSANVCFATKLLFCIIIHVNSSARLCYANKFPLISAFHRKTDQLLLTEQRARSKLCTTKRFACCRQFIIIIQCTTLSLLVCGICNNNNIKPAFSFIEIGISLKYNQQA
jgi:hypothetical protein